MGARLLIMLILGALPAWAAPAWFHVSSDRGQEAYVKRSADADYRLAADHLPATIEVSADDGPFDVRVLGPHHRVFWQWVGERSKIWPKDMLVVNCRLELDPQRIQLAGLATVALLAVLTGAVVHLSRRRTQQARSEVESAQQYVRTLEGHGSHPRQLGGYRVQKLLGQGATGEVYEVVDSYGVAYALKVPTFPRVVNPSDDEETARQREQEQRQKILEQFAREFQILQKLSHPAIVKLHDYQPDCPEHRAFLVMELLEGQTLELLMRRRGGRLPVKEALPILRSLLEALGYTHALGVWHRDLKPGNIFVLRGGAVKIIDFGFSKDLNLSLSLGADILGTPHYAAPEQLAPAAGQVLDEKIDVFAVGMIFYQMLTGIVPHVDEATNLYQLAQLRLGGVARSPHELNPQVAVELSQTTMAMLARDPAARPTAVEALARLR